jgi:hypothetical protein
MNRAKRLFRRVPGVLMPILGLCLARLVPLASPCATVRADVVLLKQGGKIEGQVVERDSSKGLVLVKLDAGGQLTLDRSQIQTIHLQRPAEAEYEKIRAHYADSVEGQWALAEWCLQNKLGKQRETHLKRVIELDPDHMEAHHALHQQQIDGRWMTVEDSKREKGMVKYKDRWIFPQEVQAAEERSKKDIAEKDWIRKLNRYRAALRRDSAQAEKDILAINDPMAVRALGRGLHSESDPDVRALYVRTLAQIDSSAATAQLAVYAIEDPVEEIRMSCLDYLKKSKSPEVVSYFAGVLGNKHKDDAEINRAGVALREMGDPSAIRPLIDALVIVRKQKVQSGNPGGIGASFGTNKSTPGQGLTAGDQTKYVFIPVQHPDVHDALVSLAGGPDFGYDADQWRAWYASRRKVQLLRDSRRD